MIIYLTTQGSKVQREGKRLIVTAENLIHTIFVWKLEQLICVGNISFTQPALSLLLQENVDTVFLRADGRFLGRLISADPGNVFLRKRQFLLTDDENACLRIAKPIVQAKIQNQATLLSRIKRTKQQDQAGDAAKILRALSTHDIPNCKSLDALRGLEGHAAALYFAAFPCGFVQDFGFTKRVRRPPTDPVNAVLSLLYTVLTNRCYAAIRQAGLDPQPGVLHSLAYNRFALPLDLVEEWRAMVVDALTLALFNTRVLDWDDFYSPEPEVLEEKEIDPLEKAVNDPLGAMSELPALAEVSDLAGEQWQELGTEQGKRPILLRPTSLKRVLTAFSKKMETEFLHPLAQRMMTYNQALVFQAKELRHAIEDQSYPYIPLTLR